MSLEHQEMNTRSIAPDGRIVILARALRTFGYGFTSVLLGVMLADTGVPTVQIGILLAVVALGSITFSLIMGMYADRVGRKRMLVISALLMMGTGFVFAFTQYFPLLLIAAFCGTISPSTNDNTPFSGMEQAILAQSSHAERHTTVFAFYNLAAQIVGAIGGLVVGLPDALSHFGIDASTSIHGLFAFYGVLAGSTALLFLQLSPAAEIQQPKERQRALLAGTHLASRQKTYQKSQKPKVRSIILKLSSLFAIDAFAGGLAVQTILAIWFRQRFGVSLESLGLLFFGVNTLAALSLLVAPWLTRRFGLLKTMIIPHFISNVFLLFVPFMPAFSLAATFLLLRQSLSKLDVPARQAYIMALVSPEERTAAASFTTIARSIAVSASPLVSGFMLSGSLLMLGLPILLASVIEVGYDATLWNVFRYVPLYTSHKQWKKVSTQFQSLHFPRRTASAPYSPLYVRQPPIYVPTQPLYFPQGAVSAQAQYFDYPQRIVQAEQGVNHSWSWKHRQIFALVDGKRSVVHIAAMLKQPPEVVEEIVNDLQLQGVIQR
jgi:MFS family permease